MLRLITGHPRSGTTYMARVLQEAGLGVSHEASGATYDGVVSYLHVKHANNYDVILHQVRDPLKTIASSMSLQPATYKEMFRTITDQLKINIPDGTHRQCVLEKPLWPMWTWYHFNRLIEAVAHRRYRIEDIEKEWPVLCEYLDIPKQDLPKVGVKTNTRPHKELTWMDLQKTDIDLAYKIQEMATRYGYKL